MTTNEKGEMKMSVSKVPEYSMRVVWSAEDDAFIAVCPELHGISAFGASYEDAVRELREVIALAVGVMLEDGEALPKAATVESYSGQTRLRMPKSLHSRLSDRAESEGVSLNTLIVSYLERSDGVDSALSHVEAVQNKILHVVLAASRATWGVRSTFFDAPRNLPKGTPPNANELALAN
jgi:predicted RNase H-like HicB family nuclease